MHSLELKIITVSEEPHVRIREFYFRNEWQVPYTKAREKSICMKYFWLKKWGKEKSEIQKIKQVSTSTYTLFGPHKHNHCHFFLTIT